MQCVDLGGRRIIKKIFFKQKTAYEIMPSLVGSEMCIRDSANIKCGDTITFRSGDKTFTWKFDVAGHRAVDLQKIAPAGFTKQPLMVYVSRNDAERT